MNARFSFFSTFLHENIFKSVHLQMSYVFAIMSHYMKYFCVVCLKNYLVQAMFHNTHKIQNIMVRWFQITAEITALLIEGFLVFSVSLYKCWCSVSNQVLTTSSTSFSVYQSLIILSFDAVCIILAVETLLNKPRINKHTQEHIIFICSFVWLFNKILL